MVNDYDQRRQSTIDSTVCTATISRDKIRWKEVEVSDISPTGLKFYTHRHFNTGETLNFNLNVYSMLSEFNLVVEGRVVRKESNVESNSYVVEFSKIDKKVQIQLDEIIKANSTIKNNHGLNADDGVYSFMLTPKSKNFRH